MISFKTPILINRKMTKVFDNRYKVERQIGKGSYGKVFLVFDKLDGSMCVIIIN